ncbi:YcxB family protein [Dyadobacter bucti]|jgi:hypothetical protein|uniref:YcxB family protein n=1 Tax=Dyadobacter bucti TaxID=2572203 RepID=UPI003F70873B
MLPVTYKLTKDELYKGLVETSRSRFITKLFRIIGSVLLAVMVYIFTVNLINGTLFFNLGFAFTLLLGLQMVFLAEIAAKIQVPALIKSKNPLTQEVKVDIRPGSYRIKGESFSNQLAWNQLHSIVETKDFFLLRVSEGSANVLPKRALNSDAITEFRNIIGAVPGLKLKLLSKNL